MTSGAAGLEGYAPAINVTTDRQLSDGDKLEVRAKAVYYFDHPREQGFDWHALNEELRNFYRRAVMVIDILNKEQT